MAEIKNICRFKRVHMFPDLLSAVFCIITVFYPTRSISSVNPVVQTNERTSYIEAADLDYENAQAVSVGGSSVNFWDLETGLIIRRIDLLPTLGVTAVACSTNGIVTVVGDYNGNLILIKSKSGEVIRRIRGHNDRISYLAIDSNNKNLLSRGGDDIKIWDLLSGQVKNSLRLDGNVTATASDDRLQALVIARHNEGIQILDLHSGVIKFDKDREREVIGARAVAIDHGGKWAAAGDYSGQWAVWDVHSGMIKHKLQNPGGGIKTIAFDPNGKFIVSGGTSGFLWFADIQTGESKKSHGGHQGRILSISIAPNSQFILTSSSEGALKLWDNQNNLALSLYSWKDASLAMTPEGYFIGNGNYQSYLKFADESFNEYAFDENVIKYNNPSEVYANLRSIGIKPLPSESLNRVKHGEPLKLRSKQYPVSTHESQRPAIRSGQIPTPKPQPYNEKDPIQIQGDYYALIIGIADYTHLSTLRTPVNDATEVSNILRNYYGFEPILLLDKNATRKNILKNLNWLIEEKLGNQDKLLVYYAGHGTRIKEKGYWLPVDAEKNDTTNWIISDEITAMLKRFRAKHVLIVSDSCYSGILYRGLDHNATIVDSTTRNNYINKMLANTARILMSSGGDEPVWDIGDGGLHSVFAKAFLNALMEINYRVFTGEYLFVNYIREPLEGTSSHSPQYDFIRNSGHNKGDFVFKRAP